MDRTDREVKCGGGVFSGRGRRPARFLRQVRGGESGVLHRERAKLDEEGRWWLRGYDGPQWQGELWS